MAAVPRKAKWTDSLCPGLGSASGQRQLDLLLGAIEQRKECGAVGALESIRPNDIFRERCAAATVTLGSEKVINLCTGFGEQAV
jgi:hypothetical protein